MAPRNNLVPRKMNPYSSGVQGASVSLAPEAANAIAATITLTDNLGNALVGPCASFVYLSDDAAGQVIAASAPSGGWAVTNSKGLLIPVVTNKAAILVCNASGQIEVTVTESAAKTFYLQVTRGDGTIQTTPVVFA